MAGRAVFYSFHIQEGLERTTIADLFTVILALTFLEERCTTLEAFRTNGTLEISALALLGVALLESKSSPHWESQAW